MARPLASLTAGLLLTVFLAACATQQGGGGGGPKPPEPGSIGIDTDVVDNTLTISAGGSVAFTVSVTFGSSFTGTVLVRHLDLPTGYSVLYQGLPLNDVDLELQQSGDVALTLVANVTPEDDVYFDVFAQGLDDNGSTRGQPQDQVNFSIVLN